MIRNLIHRLLVLAIGPVPQSAPAASQQDAFRSAFDPY